MRDLESQLRAETVVFLCAGKTPCVLKVKHVCLFWIVQKPYETT